MSCRFLRFASVLTLSLSSVSVPAGEDIGAYAHWAHVETAGRAAWYRVDLPIEVPLQAAHADLRDLRVFNAEGENVPHALTSGTERNIQNRRESMGKLFPLYAERESAQGGGDGARMGHDAEGKAAIESGAEARAGVAAAKRILRGWLIDASAVDFPLERLSLKWRAAPGGLSRFSIEASNDLEHWRHWGQGQIVRLDSNGELVDRGEVRLPGGMAHYLRLVWEGTEGGREADIITEARLSGVAPGAEFTPLAWSALLPGEPVAGSKGEYVWRFPAPLRLVRVRIPLTGDGAIAPIILAGRESPAAEGSDHDHPQASADPPPEAPWKTLARGVLYRLSAIEMEKNEFDVHGVVLDQLRLRIDAAHGDNVFAQGVPELAVAIHAPQLIFLARGGGPYRLAWGNAKAEMTALPLPILIPGELDSSRLGQARVGNGSGAPSPSSSPDLAIGEAPPEGEEDGEQKRKIVFWAMSIAGIVLLAGMAVSSILSLGGRKRD
jgi:hypothetical protein